MMLRQQLPGFAAGGAFPAYKANSRVPEFLTLSAVSGCLLATLRGVGD